MDIYYPKDSAVSHGKVHELLDPEALKRGEPLTEESIRWLLELHGEMYLIEQHYSTRTRLRRLALNGTPVAEFSDMEPLVDFQLGNANIRMSFTVRNQGIVYELFVNGKRFEDLTQALPSPIASCAEGSGMTFGEPLMFQRLGLLPPHLQQPEQQQQQAQESQQQQSQHQRQLSAASHHHQRQISLLGPLDGSISSLIQPIMHDGLAPLLDDSQTSTVSAGIVATLAYHQQQQQQQQQQQHSRQISLTHQDVFSALAVPPINVATTVTFGSTPTTAAATMGTPTTTASSDPSCASAAWADGMAVAEAPSFVVPIPPAQVLLALPSPTPMATAGDIVDLTATSASAASSLDDDNQTAMVVAGNSRPSSAMAVAAPAAAGTPPHDVHGAGALARPSVTELYFSSDDEAEPEMDREAAGIAHRRRSGRRRRGVSDIFLQDEVEEEEEEEQAPIPMAVTRGHSTPSNRRRILLPAFKVAKTSTEARPTAMASHGSLTDLKATGRRLAEAAAAEKASAGAGVGGAPAEASASAGARTRLRRGFDRVLESEAPPAIQRSLSTSDIMERPPNLKIVVPAPPTHMNCAALLHRVRKAAAGGTQAPACRPR